MWRMGPVVYSDRPPRLGRFFKGPVRPDGGGDGDGGEPEDAYSVALGRQLAAVNGGANGAPPVDVDSYWD